MPERVSPGCTVTVCSRGVVRFLVALGCTGRWCGCGGHGQGPPRLDEVRVGQSRAAGLAGVLGGLEDLRVPARGPQLLLRDLRERVPRLDRDGVHGVCGVCGGLPGDDEHGARGEEAGLVSEHVGVEGRDLREARPGAEPLFRDRPQRLAPLDRVRRQRAEHSPAGSRGWWSGRLSPLRRLPWRRGRGALPAVCHYFPRGPRRGSQPRQRQPMGISRWSPLWPAARRRAR